MRIAAAVGSTRATVLGLILLSPAALFLLANILNELGIGFLYALIDPVISGRHWKQVFNIVSPVVFLGGIAAAVLLSALAIAQLDLRWKQNRLVSTVTIAPRIPNVALILTGGLMLATLLGYALVENLTIVGTHGG